MANRVHPTPINADNSSGSSPAACNDWRMGDADSMSARITTESTLDAGYTTAGASPKAKNVGQFLAFVGEFIYDLLDRMPTTRFPWRRMIIEERPVR